MIPDPIATAGLVTREVRSGARDGQPTRIVVARRTYATGRADLWDALTNAERIPRWFLPVSGDLRVGGRYQLEGNAEGTIERCDPPARLAVTWEFAGGVSWVEVTLQPTGDSTTLELLHEAPVDPAFWEQYGPGAVGVGWDLSLMALGVHIETGEPIDPQEGLAFPTTPPGMEFVRAAATAWSRAAEADGDDAGAAHDAAARTFAFYTGAEEG